MLEYAILVTVNTHCGTLSRFALRMQHAGCRIGAMITELILYIIMMVPEHTGFDCQRCSGIVDAVYDRAHED